MKDSEFFDAISEGLSLIAEHADRLEEGAASLAAQSHGRAWEILSLIAQEEAAKYLILLDAVRCPRQPQSQRARVLNWFNSHLAKGIYARCARTRPATFGELLDFVDSQRPKFFLDGPSGQDWIFRNDVMHSREQAFYVDLVETEDGLIWWAHGPFLDMLHENPRFYSEPAAVQLVRSLSKVGFSSVEALPTVADIWRRFVPERTTSYDRLQELAGETVASLRNAGLGKGGLEDERVIQRSWPFPLWGQRLSFIDVDPDELRE